MLKRSSSRRAGFTIIDLLLTTGIIGLVAGFVYTNVDVAANLLGGHDTVRKGDVNTLMKAMNNYHWAQGSMLQGDQIPAGSANAKPVCRQGMDCSASGGVSLDSLIAMNYLSTLRQDPSEPAGSSCSGYQVYQDGGRAFFIAAHLGRGPTDLGTACAGRGR